MTPNQPRGMEDFFTRGPANEGLRVELYLPTGEKSEHWIQILGVDSDAFREADAESRRNLLAIATLPMSTVEEKAVRNRAIDTEKRKLIAVLVKAWSFDKPCTLDNVMEFLEQAPQIANQIDRVAAKRALFFAKRSSGSPSSQNTASDSTDAPTAQSKPSEPA